MDSANLEWLRKYCPRELRPKLRRLMEFAPAGMGEDVDDPYTGGPQGFETVLDGIEAACQGLLRHVRAQLQA
jgi:protein-tyrosine phosphatase